MQEMVTVTDFTKRYGSKVAVDDIAFSVHRGEVFGLLGPNGAGKTSTLECIEGLREYSQGVITIAGTDVKRAGDQIRKLLGVQLQASSLPDDMRVCDAMKLICAWHGIKTRQDLLIRFGIGQDMKKQYGQMSTGQKRRLHLALALSANPQVVVLDEPTAGLDVEGRSQLHAAIRELKEQGVTFLLATHDMAEAEMLCDRIAILIQGKIAAIGTPSEITAAGNTQTKITIVTAKGSLPSTDTPYANFTGDEKEQVWRSKQVSRAVADLLQKVDDAGDSVVDLRVERPSLEERFLEIVGMER